MPTRIVSDRTHFSGGQVSASQFLLPWGLTFAAGAMIYVISNEIIPETHRHGHHKTATAGLIVGVVVMMFLDVVFG
jgi:ZIP family zinc transporter